MAIHLIQIGMNLFSSEDMKPIYMMGWMVRRADQESFKAIKSACCTPVRAPIPQVEYRCPEVRTDTRFEMVDIPGGRGLVGTSEPILHEDEEAPVRPTKIKPFKISPTTVTNREFSAFIDATGYQTEAERYGWSFVFWSEVPKSRGRTEAVPRGEWWRKVKHARWDCVNGASSPLNDHPVVHVSWNDAWAYTKWVGGRLPSEAEWEHAARGGSGDIRFPWGDREPDDASFFPCNIWQGKFPERNDARDGYVTTAPAQSYEPNGYGLYNMVGNVWEWTADPFRLKSLKATSRKRATEMRGFKLLKGGSFLCHRSYCYRYRITARTGNSRESTTSHQGFRVVWDS